MGKWAFSNYLQYEIHLDYYTYFPLLVIVIFPGESKIIKSKINKYLCASCVHMSQSPAGWSSAVK